MPRGQGVEKGDLLASEGDRKGGVIGRTGEGGAVRRERVGGARAVERPRTVAGLGLGAKKLRMEEVQLRQRVETVAIDHARRDISSTLGILSPRSTTYLVLRY